ncbi:unnamed protein product, partial [Brenthis ino]
MCPYFIIVSPRGRERGQGRVGGGDPVPLCGTVRALRRRSSCFRLTIHAQRLLGIAAANCVYDRCCYLTSSLANDGGPAARPHVELRMPSEVTIVNVTRGRALQPDGV